MESLHGVTTGSAWASMGIIVIANLTIAHELTMFVILFLIIGSVSGVIETFIS